MNKHHKEIAGDMETIITVQTGSPATVVITKKGFDVTVVLEGGHRMAVNFPDTLTPSQICDMTTYTVSQIKKHAETNKR